MSNWGHVLLFAFFKRIEILLLKLCYHEELKAHSDAFLPETPLGSDPVCFHTCSISTTCSQACCGIYYTFHGQAPLWFLITGRFLDLQRPSGAGLMRSKDDEQEAEEEEGREDPEKAAAAQLQRLVPHVADSRMIQHLNSPGESWELIFEVCLCQNLFFEDSWSKSVPATKSSGLLYGYAKVKEQ